MKKGLTLKEGNIGLVLNSYEDIFSDFDPRSYAEKAISVDFLDECKRAASDKDEKIELRFLVPKSKRNYGEEEKIKKRLRAHFHRHYNLEKDGIKKMRKRGLIWFFIGVLIMLASTFLYGKEEFLFKLLFIVLEPAGWFIAWEGLGELLVKPKEKMPEFIFYKKMASSEIFFEGY